MALAVRPFSQGSCCRPVPSPPAVGAFLFWRSSKEASSASSPFVCDLVGWRGVKSLNTGGKMGAIPAKAVFKNFNLKY